MLVLTLISFLVPQSDYAGKSWFQFGRPEISTPIAVVHIETFNTSAGPSADTHWEVAVTTGKLWRQPEDPEFQLFRLNAGAVETLDSDHCAFAPVLREMRDLVPPYIFVPGANELDRPPGPPEGAHRGSSYTLIANTAEAPPKDSDAGLGAPVEVSLSSSHGALAVWSERFKAIVDGCDWMASPIAPPEMQRKPDAAQ
ncbi:hypothetical protein ACIQC9_14640 [Brevundimonas sp. NPDC092305]|uniref:hypothetical protein n=1 Tax=Brevundimonas sp. NPDC092305 TaxID=3363957 RepID=UPI0037FD69B5